MSYSRYLPEDSFSHVKYMKFRTPSANSCNFAFCGFIVMQFLFGNHSKVRKPLKILESHMREETTECMSNSLEEAVKQSRQRKSR